MKKIIVSLAVAFAVFTGRTYAAAAGPSIPVSVTDEFTHHFAGASDVTWEIGKTFYKATFDMHGKTLFAFYAGNGSLMGVAHNLSPVNLPDGLRDEIKDSYAGYWITELFTYQNDTEKAFVITLESPEKIVVLKGGGQSAWTVYKTVPRS